MSWITTSWELRGQFTERDRKKLNNNIDTLAYFAFSKNPDKEQE